MQLGFVIDHSRCIGCHACTVACKSENDVPLGSFRTWVKYTESGTFPEVKRDFAVLRCNQCTDAPCITICPVTALDKRNDGIVDIDPSVCIGCKACMQACPYDALYIHPEQGTAQKCHFCAHRTSIGLAPACAVVCPTEAIIPGDFHDPNSAVSKLKASGELSARKTEAGTGPNVLYRDAAPAGLDPSLTNLSGGSIWATHPDGVRLDAQMFEALEDKARESQQRKGAVSTARTVYDVPRDILWGSAITGYLFFKSVAAGCFMAGAGLLLPWAGEAAAASPAAVAVPLAALLALAVTMVLLVADLKRPERFLKILLRPNMDSWLAKGSFILMGYGMLLTLWLGLGFAEVRPAGALAWPLQVATIVLGALSAGYTGWLFAQAKGRVLWMRRGLWLHLMVQALVAGAAALLLLRVAMSDFGTGRLLELLLLVGANLHLLFMLTEGRGAPEGRHAEYARAVRLLSHGPFAAVHWGLGVGLGAVLPILLLGVGLLTGADWTAPVAAVAALVGLWFEEDAFVRAGQALPIS